MAKPKLKPERVISAKPKTKAKAPFDFAKALAELKKSKSLASTKKKLEVIFQEMHHWENTDNILEKPADQIVQIGYLLMNYDAKEQLDFYQRLLSKEFDDLRAKFDHYDLAYFYRYVGECFSRNALPADEVEAIYKKTEYHLEAIEIDKYGVDSGLRLYAGYHNSRAMDAYRHRDFTAAHHHLHESSSYSKKIISVSQDPEWIERAQKSLYNLHNIRVAILIQQREFHRILEQKENLEELVRFVEKSPSAWTRLFNLRGNYGVAELCLGRIAEALQSFQFITALCQKYQNLPMEESDDLQLSLSYECLALSLITQNASLKGQLQRLKKIFTNPISQSQKYYAFVVAWSELLADINTDVITSQLQSQFNKVQNLALQCQMQDFQAEWEWFAQALMNQKPKEWKGALKKAPFPMFKR